MSGMAKAQAEDHALPSHVRAWSASETAVFMTRLRGELREAGVFRGDAAAYRLRALWVLVVTACTWSAFLFVDTWPARVAIGILAGYIGVQASAIAHEAGHGAVTRDARWSWFIGRFFMTFLIGAFYGAWVERHEHALVGTGHASDV